MTKIEILASGHINRADSAFPTLVRLDNGDIICGFSVGGGPSASGGTDWARSTDGGQTWTWEGTILPRTENPVTTNSLRLSRTREGTVIAYGQRNYPSEEKGEWGTGKNEPIFCLSSDNGRTWSSPHVIHSDRKGPFEISNPVVVLADGRWLAPAAVLGDPKRLGEYVIAFESSDKGRTWPSTRTVLKDPEGLKGFFEQKLIELEPDMLLAVAWTVSLGDYKDFENHFAISKDGGRTWSPPRSTGIRGQTMTPLWLGDDRLLVVYNRRYGRQGVVICLVRFTETRWEVEWEHMLWDAKKSRQRGEDVESGIDEMSHFEFGLPSVLRLDEKSFLAVHWCKEEGIFGIRWTKLRLD